MIHSAKKRPVTDPVLILHTVGGILDMMDVGNDFGVSWGLFEYNRNAFGEVYAALVEHFGVEHVTYESVIYNMMVCGKHVYVYDHEMLERTRLTIHKLDSVIQNYLTQEPDFESWNLDDYDTILQYALYGNLVHI